MLTRSVRIESKILCQAYKMSISNFKLVDWPGLLSYYSQHYLVEESWKYRIYGSLQGELGELLVKIMNDLAKVAFKWMNRTPMKSKTCAHRVKWTRVKMTQEHQCLHSTDRMDMSVSQSSRAKGRRKPCFLKWQPGPPSAEEADSRTQSGRLPFV